jgi:hypothetical protein
MTGHLACMGTRKYKILVEISEGKRQFGRSKHRSDDTIKITVKPVLSGPFIKRNFVLNGYIFRSRDYRDVPRLNGNLASAEKCSGPLIFCLRQVLLYS